MREIAVRVESSGFGSYLLNLVMVWGILLSGVVEKIGKI